MTDEAFISRVRARVAELGDGPIALAEAGGLQRDFIADLLNGKKRSIHASSLVKLAKALRMTVDELQGKEPQDAALQRIIEIAGSLHSAERAVLLATAEALSSKDALPSE